MLDCRAYTEVNVIIDSLSSFERNKIPQKIRDNIKQRMDKNYKFTIDVNNIKHTALLNDSKKILSVLYSDYLSTNDEKEVITKIEKNIYIENEEKRKEKYNPDNIFKNKKNKMEEIDNHMENTNNSLIEYKGSILNKIFRKIKSIFKRNYL